MRTRHTRTQRGGEAHGGVTDIQRKQKEKQLEKKKAGKQRRPKTYFLKVIKTQLQNAFSLSDVRRQKNMLSPLTSSHSKSQGSGCPKFWFISTATPALAVIIANRRQRRYFYRSYAAHMPERPSMRDFWEEKSTI